MAYLPYVSSHPDLKLVTPLTGTIIIVVGALALALVPKSPYHTGNLFGGLIRIRGWLNEHEADILTARQARRSDHHAAGSKLKISWKDMSVLSPRSPDFTNFSWFYQLTSHRTDVLFHWATWPYLITCLSGLQSVNGLSTWGTTIIKSLGFSSIRANLLNAPGSLLSAIFAIGLSAIVDRYNRFGYPILFAGVWTLAGLVALYVCLPYINYQIKGCGCMY